MATNTSRVALRKPATSDNVSVTLDLNNNYDKIDSHLGQFVCTSATRPTGTDRFTGRTCWESDTEQFIMWDGSAWKYTGGSTMTAAGYTLTITGGTSGTASNGDATVNTAYKREGEWVSFFARYTLGATTNFSTAIGTFNFLLPPIAGTQATGTIIGTGAIADASTGDRFVCALMIEDSTHHSLVITRAGSALVTNAVPWTWAQNDTIRFEGRYKVV